MQIIPTILEKDFAVAEAKINLIKDKTKWIQIDVIDGYFNEGKSFELELLNKLRIENNLIEIHLMVKEPIKWIEKCNFVGATRIIGQVEMMNDVEKFVEEVKNDGLEAGLAFDINTEIKKIPEETDLVLIMGRKSGFEKANFEEKIIEKIKKLEKMRMENNLDFKIGIDGGVDEKVIEEIRHVGVDIAYCGGAIFNGNIVENFNKLNYVSEN
jgi:ribulose-phosphate 3-epimerase